MTVPPIGERCRVEIAHHVSPEGMVTAFRLGSVDCMLVGVLHDPPGVKHNRDPELPERFFWWPEWMIKAVDPC